MLPCQACALCCHAMHVHVACALRCHAMHVNVHCTLRLTLALPSADASSAGSSIIGARGGSTVPSPAASGRTETPWHGEAGGRLQPHV